MSGTAGAYDLTNTIESLLRPFIDHSVQETPFYVPTPFTPPPSLPAVKLTPLARRFFSKFRTRSH